MIDPELLALLTAHGADPLRPPGGIPSLTQMDVAGMMARCTPCEAALLRAKYAGDKPHSAWAYWFEHLMAQGWSHRPGQIDALSKITLLEHISDNRCALCEGRQGWLVGSSYQVCPVCQGSGVVFLTPGEFAQRLKIRRFAGPWPDRVQWCRRELVDWEHRALGKIR